MSAALYEPESLRHLCLEYCLNHLELTLCTVEPETENFLLRDNIRLPLSLCSDLIETCRVKARVLGDEFLSIFSDPERTCLRKLDLTNSVVTDDVLERLCNHSLQELNLSNCENLTHSCVHHINKTAKTLQILHLGDSFHILSSDEFLDELAEICDTLDPPPDRPTYGHDYIFNAPNLQAFSIHDLRCLGIHDLVATLLYPFKKLQHLDVSGCAISIEYMDCLEDMKGTLKSLVLHEVPISSLEEAFSIVSKLKQLRHLDLSCHGGAIYPHPVGELRKLVAALPNLVSLDISGTNLAGTGLECDEKGDRCCPIPGLEGRHFEFLGLFKCADSACYRENIPADKVTGDATQGQILCSVCSYIDRPALLHQSLESVFQLLRTERVHNPRPMCMAVVNAMERYPKNKNIQVTATASLFFFAKHDDGNIRPKYGVKVIQRMVRCTLNAVEYHLHEQAIVRNVCLTLCQFDLPGDIRFDYPRMVALLIRILDQRNQEEFIMRITAYLLNALSCQVNGPEKLLIGDLRGVHLLVKLIQDRLENEVCDEVMTISWSAMWNITDETPENCRRFIDLEGMRLFLNCLETFPEKDELRRNMMGLMGNIAEVKFLRSQLMQTQFVKEFSTLLESTTDGIEVSYNAAGVLSHMLSDGAEAWTIQDPDRQSISDKVIEAINRWDLSSSRNINYRSFRPILDLTECYDVPAAQHWAVWALCNLTKVYPKKYCPLVVEQEGVVLLKEILNSSVVNVQVKTLASMVIEQCRRYERRNDDEHDGADIEMENQ